MTNDEAPTTAAAGEYLRAARRAAALTQPELAERSGVAVRTISQLETGRSGSTRASTLIKLAHALDIEEDALVRAFGGGTVPPHHRPRGRHNDDHTHIPVPVDALTAAFSAITTLLADTDSPTARQQIATAAGELFTAYAITLIERSATSGTSHDLIGLIRMQTHAFPDPGPERDYLTWLLGDLDHPDAAQLTTYQTRWKTATS